MATQGFKPEREFIIDLAVSRFNSQFGRAIDPADCLVKSIEGNYGCVYGYEIITARTDDYLRLHLYFNLGTLDSFGNYRLEVDTTYLTNSLGDEIYATIGTVNAFYLDEGIYRFRPMADEGLDDIAVTFMAGDPFVFMSGEEFEYVGL